MTPSKLALIAVASISILLVVGCSKEQKTEPKTEARAEVRPTGPSVIMLMLDTLRADHMGVYGYQRNTTPEIDAFSQRATVYERAYAATPWTPSSVASIFTGLYAASHGMVPPNSRQRAKTEQVRLASGFETLAEILQAAGYRTAAISPNPWITKTFGFEQGFDEFYYLERAIAEKITDNGIEVLERLATVRRPFFLYLHYFDPHDPYTPPVPYGDMFRGEPLITPYEYGKEDSKSINAYDGEIRYMDHQIGRLFRYLEKFENKKEIMVVIVSDHGEQFMEHGSRTHGYNIYREETHVPLIIRYSQADKEAVRVDSAVSHIDILPTILDNLDLPIPAHRQGVSLLSGEQLINRQSVLSEVRRVYEEKGISSSDGKRLLFNKKIQPDKSFLESLDQWQEPLMLGLFNIDRDPAEKRPTFDSPEAVEMKEEFHSVLREAIRIGEDLRSRHGEEERMEISEERLDQLESLGYLN